MKYNLHYGKVRGDVLPQPHVYIHKCHTCFYIYLGRNFIHFTPAFTNNIFPILVRFGISVSFQYFGFVSVNLGTVKYPNGWSVGFRPLETVNLSLKNNSRSDLNFLYVPKLKKV